MMRISFLTLVFITTAHFCMAQTPALMVKSSDKGLFLDHKVAAKENFYSIGRLYNLPPKEIAAYNKLDINKGLNLGQMIRIQLSSANFSQTVNEGTPVYYKVGENEGLQKVSNANNKVMMASLRKWNHLGSDNLIAGSKLVIGFLNSTEMPVVKIVEKKEPVQVNTEKKEKTDPTPVIINKEPIAENKPVVENKMVQNPVVQSEPVKTSTGQGYFRSSFEQQVKVYPLSKNETVTSGIFKTTSGWVDAKYYALIDGVQSGTILKVINPSNNKTVYAKVLGEMSGIHQNEGLNLRISSAAASALQITEQDKFVVQVNY